MTTPSVIRRAVPEGPAAAGFSASMRHVVEFLRSVRGLPPEAWQSALAAAEGHHGAGTIDPRTSESVVEELADYAARRRLRIALESMPVIVPAVRARVDAALATFEGIMPVPMLTRMRRAVRLAALALAAESLLRPEDVERLCRPFRGLLPPLHQV